VVCCGSGSDTQRDVSCKRFCTTTPVIRPRPRPVQFTTAPLCFAANLPALHPDLSYTPYLSARPFCKDSSNLMKYLSDNRVTSQKTWIFQNRFCYEFLIKEIYSNILRSKPMKLVSLTLTTLDKQNTITIPHT